MEYSRYYHIIEDGSFLTSAVYSHTFWWVLSGLYVYRIDRCYGRMAGEKKGMASEFGAKLDSMADLLFYGVVLLKLLPVLWQMLPMTLWYAVAAVVFVRLMSYVVVGIKYHRFASLHTWLNKLTGVGAFLLPYVLVVTDGVTYA